MIQAMAPPRDVLFNDEDREFVERLEDDAHRAVVLASLRRHRVPERLDPGDPVPDVPLHPAGGGAHVRLASLVGGGPVLLVFGSFT
jgi:hypothetical protein